MVKPEIAEAFSQEVSNIARVPNTGR